MSFDSDSLQTYFGLMNANGTAQVYHTARELGILARLQTGPATLNEIATACNLQIRPLELLLTALTAMGLVQSAAGRFQLSMVAQLLMGSDYRELGNQYWRHLPTFLRTAIPLTQMDDVAQSEAHYLAQAAMLGWMLTPAARVAAEKLQSRIKRRGISIADVGAGSAIWSLSLAALDPEARVTAIDWPAVLEVARETAENLGLTDSLATIAGDCHEVELPQSAFDLAIVANLTHLQSPAQNEALFRRLHAALNDGGWMAIVDGFPGAAEGDTPFELYQLGLALRTKAGRVHSADELQQQLEASGFERGELIPLDAPPYFVGLLLARKTA